MAKKIQGYLKLQVPAGSATPSPPIGPALGQRGLAILVGVPVGAHRVGEDRIGRVAA